MTPHSRIRRSAYHQRTIRLCSAGGIWRQLFVLSQFVFLRVFGKQFLCIPLMVFDPADLWNHVSEAPQHGRAVYLRHGCRERLGYNKLKLIERPREGVVRGKFRCGSRSLLRCSRRGGRQGLHVHRGAKPRNEGIIQSDRKERTVRSENNSTVQYEREKGGIVDLSPV